jgi:hypothetical protein
MRLISPQIIGNIAPVTFSNVTSGNIIPTTTIPGVDWQIGRRLIMRAWGLYSTHSSAPTLVTNLWQLSNRNITPAYTLPVSVENYAWEWIGEILLRSTGAGGHSVSSAFLRIQKDAAGICETIAAPRALEFSTVVGQPFDVRTSFVFSTANAANVITCQNYVIEAF